MAPLSKFRAWFRPSRFVMLTALLFIIGIIVLMMMFDHEAAWREQQNQVRSTLQLTRMLQQEIGDELKNTNNFITLIESELANTKAQSRGATLSVFLKSHIHLLSEIQHIAVLDATGEILAQSTQTSENPAVSTRKIHLDALFKAISKTSSASKIISVDTASNTFYPSSFQISARISGVKNTTLGTDTFVILQLSTRHIHELLNSITSIKDGATLAAALLHTDGTVIAASKQAFSSPTTRNSADSNSTFQTTHLEPTTWLAQAIARPYAALEPLSLTEVEAPILATRSTDINENTPALDQSTQSKRTQLSYAQLSGWPIAAAVWTVRAPANLSEQSSFAFHTMQRLHAATAVLCLIILVCALAASRALQQREESQTALRDNQSTLRLLSDDLAQAQRIGRIGRWHWHIVSDTITFSDDYAEFMQVDTGGSPQKMRDWILKITHPEEIDFAISNYQNRVNGKPFGHERRIISKRGEVRWCYTAGEPVFDTSGTLIAYRGITRDITEAKSATIQQQSLAQELEAAQEIAQMGHFTWLLADDTVTGSASFNALYEVTNDTRPATAKELIENFTEGQHQLNAMSTYALRHHGKPFRLDRQITTYKKNKKWIETVATPFFDANQVLLGYRGVQRDISATKEAAIAVAQSEERYRLISDNMLDIVCLLEDDSTVRYVSRSISRTLGYDPAASIGVRFNNLVHPDDLAAVLSAHAELRNTDALRSHVECRFKTMLGDYIWLESIVTKLPDSAHSGLNTLFLVVARDASQRKKAEEALQASETRFRRLTHLSSDWYWETDAAGRFTFFSRPHPIIHNLPLEKILGQHPLEIFPDQLNAMQIAEHAQLLERHEPFRNFAFTARDCYGVVVAHAISNGEPYFNCDSGFAGYRGTGRDVSAEKFALNALKTSSQRFESLTRLSVDWYWEQDANYRFTFYSHPIIVGSTESSSIFYGKTRWELYPDALSEAQWQQHRAQLDARLPFHDLVLTVKSQSETDPLPMDRYFSLSGTPIFDEHNVFIGYRGTGRDLTIAKRAELALAQHAVQLERANKLLDQEATRRIELERNTLISIEMELAQVGLELHDQLGQDLTGIAFLIKILEKRLATTQSSDATEAAKIGALVSQAIKHTRMISHGLSPYIWGADGLISAINQLSADINMLGVAQCSATMDADIIITDDLVARSFYRIAQEATNNALKHGKATQVEISLTETDNIVALEICDNGIGVTKAIADAPDRASPFPNKPGYSYSIQHRASLIGATVTVTDNPSGGTVVTVLRPRENQHNNTEH
jgi:PAS domain S-box-containing protein